MSKFKVRAGYGNVTKFVEMDRSSTYAINPLISSLRNIFKVNNFTIAYNAPNGSFVYIKTDEQLKHAVDEFAKSRQRHLDIKVIGDGGSYTAPSYNRSNSPPRQRSGTSSSTPQPQPTSSPSYSSQSPSYSSQSPSQTEYEEPPIATFTIAADSRTSATKVRVSANASYDHFLFTSAPSKYDTTVTVFVEEVSKLVFKIIHTEGHTQVKSTQSFMLPFAINKSKIEYINTSHGQDVRVNM